MTYEFDEFKPGDIVAEHWSLELDEGWGPRERWLGVIIQHGDGVAIRWIDGPVERRIQVMTIGSLTEIYDRAKNYD